jgi:predicted transposase YdaD
VVIYPSRAVESENLHPYRWLLASDQLTRVYLDELRNWPEAEFGFALLQLIIAKPSDSIDIAKAMIETVNASDEVAAKRREMIEWIETIMSYQLPGLSREEFEYMLQVSDFRQTKIYKEAVAEGIEKGIEKGAEQFARRLVAKKFPLEEIADLSVGEIKRLKNKRGK